MADPAATLLRDRKSRRKFYADRAQEQAAWASIQPERSLSCLSPPHLAAVQSGDLTAHPSCVGLAGAGPFGCLCPCHDPHPSGSDVRPEATNGE